MPQDATTSPTTPIESQHSTASQDLVDVEFDRQVELFISDGRAALAELDPDTTRSRFAPLRTVVATTLTETGLSTDPGHAPFVLVAGLDVVPAEQAVPLLTLPGRSKPGIVDRNHAPGDLAGYRPLPALGDVSGDPYALIDVDRGEEFCNVRPEDATAALLTRGRTPLTIDEGIALVAAFPELLAKNRCFMLSGSRRSDRRVPALWISEGRPKLGWCWDGNPHTWLGTASTRSRIR